MKNKGKLFTTVLFILLIGSIVFFTYKGIPAISKGEVEEEKELESKELGVPIETITVKKEDLIERVTYVGTIHSKDIVEVSSKIAGEIVEFNVEEGQFIRPGEIIARLDNENLLSKLNTTKAKINTIEHNIEYLVKEEEKYKTLLDGNAISQSSYDKIKHEREMAQMQVKELTALSEELSISIKDTVVNSPIEGRVRTVNNSIGDLAVMGKPMVIIDDISELVVKVAVTESDLGRINEGTKANLKITGVKDVVNTRVTRIMPTINPKTRIGEVEIVLPNKEWSLPVILGSSVNTEFVLEEAKESVVIPVDSIKELAEGSVVYKVEEDKVSEVPVTTGIRVGNSVQVIEGIKENDRLAIKNIDKLYHGASVYVLEGEDK